MGYFKLIIVMVMLERLDSVQNKDNHTYTFETSESESNNVSCPLNDLNITSFYNSEDDYISFNLSWSETNNTDDVSVLIYATNSSFFEKGCLFSKEIPMHSLNNNFIIEPTTKKINEYGIDPGCEFEVNIKSEEKKISCTLNYTVPDCVGNKCDCDKFDPTPLILNVEHHTSNNFFVEWNPGERSIGNYSYEIRSIEFEYVLEDKEFFPIAETAKEIEQNLEQHVTEISMDLYEGQKYKLIGTFKNNFSCTAIELFYFKAPIKNGDNIVGYALIASFAVIIIILLLINFKYTSKYRNKVLNCILPCISNRDIHLSTLQNDQIPMNLNVHYTPVEFLEGVDNDYEIPRNKIIFKESIGNGAFGKVYSAKAFGIEGNRGCRMVAVKVLGEKENITTEQTNDFKTEIEIFKKIGKHPNVVALIGCCTRESPLMMIMELVPCGDLKKYLLELREEWFKKKRAIEQSRDTSDGAYIEVPTTRFTFKTSPLTPTTPQRLSLSEPRFKFKTPPSTPTMTAPLISQTLDEQLPPLLSSFSNALRKVLDHQELQKFALQIARGMAHLEKIPISHRDLAARNILINEKKVLKISDFGLSRCGPYINHKTKKLPLRWMALEAITEQKYDSKSDVWSFGVVLWEIGTLGAFPYEYVPDSYVQQYLQMGKRLERPEICTDELYSLMNQCWAADPKQRPTFQELVDALDDKKSKLYVNFDQLNPGYVFPPSNEQNPGANHEHVPQTENSS